MHLIIGVAAGVLLILLVRYLSRVLLPFFVACFIAYLCSRWWSSTVVSLI